MEYCEQQKYKPISKVKFSEDRYGIGLPGSSNLSNAIVANASGKGAGKDYFWKKEIEYNGQDKNYER